MLRDTLTDFLKLHFSVHNIKFDFDNVKVIDNITFNDKYSIHYKKEIKFDILKHNVYIKHGDMFELWNKNNDWLKFKNKRFVLDNARIIKKHLKALL